ncbi:hypothetical protein BJX96DRAFT_33083 [Aspergillus floccosus]
MPGDHCCRSLQSTSPLLALFCLVLSCRTVRGQKSEILSYRSERSSRSIDERTRGHGMASAGELDLMKLWTPTCDHLSGWRCSTITGSPRMTCLGVMRMLICP